MTTDTIADRSAEDIASEIRWTEGVAESREYDRQLKKRALVGLAAIVVVVALGLLFIR